MSGSGRLSIVSSLAERLQWILDNRLDAKGKAWSRRSLSLAAGLSQSHVGQLIRGTLGDRPAAETVAAIAAAAQVDVVWLMTGTGGPDLPGSIFMLLVVAAASEGSSTPNRLSEPEKAAGVILQDLTQRLGREPTADEIRAVMARLDVMRSELARIVGELSRGDR